MPHYSYDRLTALDTSFLVLEKPNSYMHVASTQIFEAGPLRTEDGGIDFEAIRKAHAAVLHRIPRYRQVLRFVPFEAHPVWVDDHHFALDYHLRHTSLPRPGTDAQLKRLSARIMQQHLDRDRPLWETWVVEGLEGDRFALITKVHHCMIDGVSGVDLLQILLSPDPQAQPEAPPPWIPRPVPSGLQLLRDEIARRLRLPFDAARDFRAFLRDADDVRRELRLRARAVRETLGETMRRASETPINERIGPHRRFDWFAIDIAEVAGIRAALGGSLNDVVLTIATGAFRRFFHERGIDVSQLDFRVLAPVSVRNESQRGALGNRVSSWVIPLPLDTRDPRAQLAAISSRTATLKESKRAVGAEVLTRVAEWTPTTLLSLGARNSSRLLPFNSVITNVPGPRIPMYLLGARLREAYPHVPLVDQMGLGIALLSCEGRLHWGVNADYDLVPDLPDFIAALQDSFAELSALAAENAQARRARLEAKAAAQGGASD
jgi:diacylglycerol O-acyltransferase / wax synthase